MKLIDIINERDLGKVLDDLLEPQQKRPPQEKGPDAIKVQGYIVRGHWRKRGIPIKVIKRAVSLRRIK